MILQGYIKEVSYSYPVELFPIQRLLLNVIPLASVQTIHTQYFPQFFVDCLLPMWKSLDCCLEITNITLPELTGLISGFKRSLTFKIS